MTRVHLMLTALLPILLWCSSPVLSFEGCSSAAIQKSTEGGYVELKDYNVSQISVLERGRLLLHCSGKAIPHGKISWYKSDARRCLPILGNLSFYYHYDIKSTIDQDNRVYSTLSVEGFSEVYAGAYYCVLVAGGDHAAELSPAMNVSFVELPSNTRPSEPPKPQGTPPPDIDFRLKLNITAEKVNDSTVLLRWTKKLRNNNAKLCRNRFKWQLEVMMWEPSELPGVVNQIWNQTFDHNVSRMQSTIQLTATDCKNNWTYVNINLSESLYYKFRIIVNNTKTNEVVKGSDKYGSYLHYFGKQSRATISYPREGQRIPFNGSCIVGGEPKPHLLTLGALEDVLNPFARTCIATNYHINPPREVETRHHIINYYVEPPPPPADSRAPPQSRCEKYEVWGGVCSGIIPHGSFVNVTSDSNITILEERAASIFEDIQDHNNCQDLMKAFVCNALFPRCHPDFVGKRRTVCRQSCLAVKQCGGKIFQMIQEHFPPSSEASGNCTSLVDTEAGDAPECILLTAPQKDREDFTDGSCLVGRGQEYTGNISETESGRSCLPWNQQQFYPDSIFPELQGARSSCRNPGGKGNRPWCYVNFTKDATVRWEYCDIPKCPSCKPVPETCKDVQGYSTSTSVLVRNDAEQQMEAIEECVSAAPCFNVLKNITCHLTFPKCVPNTPVNQLHTARPLCKAYCELIKTTLDTTCPFSNDCDMSKFVLQLPENCSMLPEKDCIEAVLDLPTVSSSTDPSTDGGSNSQKHLAMSIFVAAAVCLVSVLTIIGIVVGYCCCCYFGSEPTRNALIKPIPNPLDNPVFATMKFKYVTNPDYCKGPIESTSAFADKSLRPISKTQIHYIRDLGSGNFGLVYQGKVEKIIEGEEFTMAAIKTLREGSSAEGMKNFLHEAKLACQFDHDNIIKLYGICMSEGFYCLVFEYMDLGDLNEYLRGSASSTQRRIMNPLDSASRSRTESSLSNNPPRLNVQQLVSICHQIALGMEYFASLNHVHRDLATRNCLVATGLVVKIGDFGMSQTLYHSDYYKQRGEQALPVRWMAPEAFIYGRFSSEGDVWSFGVVMWEVFSFAMQPYYGKMNDQVMNEVRRGHTLSQPDDCPSSIFEIMRSCWQMEPHRRPTFSELVDELNSWRPTHCSTSTALESQGSIRDDIEDSVSLPSIQDKDVDLDSSVFDDCNMSGTEEDIAD